MDERDSIKRVPLWSNPLLGDPTTGKVLADGWVQMGEIDPDVSFVDTGGFEDIPEDIPAWGAQGSHDRSFTVSWSLQETDPRLLELFFGEDISKWAPNDLPWHKRYWLKFKRKLRGLYERLRGSVADRLADLVSLFGA